MLDGQQKQRQEARAHGPRRPVRSSGARSSTWLFSALCPSLSTQPASPLPPPHTLASDSHPAVSRYDTVWYDPRTSEEGRGLTALSTGHSGVRKDGVGNTVH